MKIGIYSPRAGTRRAGGTETFLREMMHRISEDILLVTGHGELLDSVENADNVDVRQVGLRYKEDTVNEYISRYTPVLAAEIESISMYANLHWADVQLSDLRSCDVVSTHYYLDNLLVSRGLDGDVPTVFRFPGIARPSPRWGTMLRFDRADRYVSNSESTADRLREWYGLDIDLVVPPGVDTARFAPDDDADSSRFTVLFVGRIDEGKGVPELIDAVSKCMDATLRVVGDGNRRRDYETLAAEALPPDRYEFIGEVDHGVIHREYQRADVFCLPSHHESFGMTVVEAMACGTPVIASDIDAIREHIADGVNGILVEPGDPEAIANAIADVQGSATRRRELADRGRRTALNYNWDVQAELMANVYQEVAL